jgi:hypothetical protein
MSLVIETPEVKFQLGERYSVPPECVRGQVSAASSKLNWEQQADSLTEYGLSLVQRMGVKNGVLSNWPGQGGRAGGELPKLRRYETWGDQ